MIFTVQRSCTTATTSGARNPNSFITRLVNGVSQSSEARRRSVSVWGYDWWSNRQRQSVLLFSYDEQRRNFPGIAVFSTPGYLNTVNRHAYRKRADKRAD